MERMVRVRWICSVMNTNDKTSIEQLISLWQDDVQFETEEKRIWKVNSQRRVLWFYMILPEWYALDCQMRIQSYGEHTKLLEVCSRWWYWSVQMTSFERYEEWSGNEISSSKCLFQYSVEYILMFIIGDSLSHDIVKRCLSGRSCSVIFLM